MLNVIYEDNHIIVVIKPHNMPSQADISGDRDLLTEVKEYIKEKYNKPGEAFVGLVHRLDRPTGGIMVFAKTSKAGSRLSSQIREHKTKKVYYTIVEGLPRAPEETIVNNLKKDEKNNIVKIVTQTEEGAKKAELRYKVLETEGDFSLLEVTLLTGRSHQIRVQLNGVGLPIYGDAKYNNKESGKFKGGLALWAGRLEFDHPVTKERLVFIAPPDATKEPWNKFYIDKYFVR